MFELVNIFPLQKNLNISSLFFPWQTSSIMLLDPDCLFFSGYFSCFYGGDGKIVLWVSGNNPNDSTQSQYRKYNKLLYIHLFIMSQIAYLTNYVGLDWICFSWTHYISAYIYELHRKSKPILVSSEVFYFMISSIAYLPNTGSSI